MTLLILRSTVDCPTVFHVPINGRVARLNLVMSHGRADDQSLGRSPGFPGSRVLQHYLGVLRVLAPCTFVLPQDILRTLRLKGSWTLTK